MLYLGSLQAFNPPGVNDTMYSIYDSFKSLIHFKTVSPQGDRGGRLTLQKRWTSFLKARLMCSLSEYDFHFNMLRSVFVVPGQTPQDTLFYGIFGLEW